MLFCDGVNVSNWTLYLVWPGFDPMQRRLGCMEINLSYMAVVPCVYFPSRCAIKRFCLAGKLQSLVLSDKLWRK